MSTHLSRLFRQRRLENFSGYGEVARRCGYRNIAKGSNRIQKFEDRGEIATDLLLRLADVLFISEADVVRAVALDQEEWDRWADVSIRPYLVIRLMAAIYTRAGIPTELHADRCAMEQYALDFVKKRKLKVCLVLSRRIRVWFDRDGCRCETHDTFEKSYEPFMRIKGSGTKFLLNLTKR